MIKDSRVLLEEPAFLKFISSAQVRLRPIDRRPYSVSVYLSWGSQSCCSAESQADSAEVPGGGRLSPTAQSPRSAAPHTSAQLWLP